MRKKIALSQYSFLMILACLFFSQIIFSQLSNFTLSVIKTDETCSGNGSLTFATSGTTAGSSLFYSIYLLPDTTSPIAVINTLTLTGLSSGNYKVVALQTLGALSNSQQQEIEILDQRNQLAYQAVAQPVNCTSGNIKVEVSQGSPFTYEIISPIVVPPQTSNEFLNLPLGEYNIRVVDVCGDAIVQTCTIIYVFSPQNLLLPSLGFQDCKLVDCDTSSVRFNIRATEDSFVAYPFTFELTVFPPMGGTPLVFSQVVSSGVPENSISSFNLPLFDSPDFSTLIRIIDSCGNVTSINGTGVYRSPTFNLTGQPGDTCPKEIKIDLCNVLLPVTVTFIESPPGFNPSLFNQNGLGPFNNLNIKYATTIENELPDGIYIVKVTDACGISFQESIEVKYSITEAFVDIENMIYIDCVANFPLDIPNLQVPPISVIVSSAPPNFNFPVPYDYSYAIEKGQFYECFNVPGEYTFTGINICGLPYSQTVTVPVLVPETEIYGFNVLGCDATGRIRIRNPLMPPTQTVVINQAPSTFNQSLPYVALDLTLSEDPTNDVFIEFLPAGDYTVTIYDVCGTEYGPLSINVPFNLYKEPPTISVFEGCAPGFGSVKLSIPSEGGTFLETVVIVGAPADYQQNLPFDVSFNIDSPFDSFYMNSLPEGTYTFYAKDTCGTEHTFDVVIGNHFFDTEVAFEGNCGSFNLFLENTGSNLGFISFWLQRYNPVDNRWEHPLTGANYQEGILPNGINSYLLSANNYNIAALGTFRVIAAYAIYSNGNPILIFCPKVLKEFEFIGTLKISNAFKIACSNGGSQVLIVAGDTSALTYQIIAKNGQPFFVENFSSNVFNNLTPAIYKFQVKDLCGNIVTRLFDLAALTEPVVTSSILCDGQVGQLNVQPFSFLSYQWWKGDNPSIILSTSSTLNFSPFSVVTSPGVYYVRVYSETVFSCVDITIPYTISNVTAPKAGDDNAISICSLNSINLNTLLAGVHDAFGVWTEISNSGMLTGSSWLPIGLAEGIYTFKYTVYGFCGIFDEALITINLNNELASPIVSVSSNFCVGDSIQFDVSDIPNAIYEWSGPNNFSSNSQNLLINNSNMSDAGNYNIKATANGCESSTDIAIFINPIPDFKLETNCVNNINTISIVPISNSFTLDSASYVWEGPGNFTSTDIALVLNNLSPGIYSVTVLNDGCTETKSIDIQNTRCAIPVGISPNGDEKNETFDLTGFGENIKFKIFNRYGTMVFEQDNYKDQWYGQDYNGHILPDATYFYYIRLKSGEEKTGWVYVSR